MHLEDLQISVGGPADGRALELHLNEIVRFNYRMNSLSDNILRALSPWSCGDAKKAAILFSSCRAINLELIDDVLMINAPANKQLILAGTEDRTAIFSETLSLLEYAAKFYDCDPQPILRCKAAIKDVNAAHRVQFGKPAQRRSDGARAAGRLIYGLDSVQVGADVEFADRVIVVTLWSGEVGKTYWHQFSGLLGTVKWELDGRLSVVPKRKWLGARPDPVQVVAG